VGTKPWRARGAEAVLLGKPANNTTFAAAAAAAVQGAVPRQHNTFKVEMAKRALVRALSTVVEVGGKV
jgi:xanthine dehydrogenase YagS FAD-binding subunit